MSANIEELADGVVDAVKAYVAEALAAMTPRLKALERRCEENETAIKALVDAVERGLR